MSTITNVSREALWKEVHKNKDSYKQIVRIITKNDEDILCSIVHTGEDSIRIRFLKKDVKTVKYNYIKSLQVLDATGILQIVTDLIESRDKAIAALVGISVKSEGILKLTDEALKKIR